MVPVLGGHLGQVIMEGHIKIGYQDGSFVAKVYGDRVLPINPASYATILHEVLKHLEKSPVKFYKSFVFNKIDVENQYPIQGIKEISELSNTIPCFLEANVEV